MQLIVFEFETKPLLIFTDSQRFFCTVFKLCYKRQWGKVKSALEPGLQRLKLCAHRQSMEMVQDV